MRTQKELVRWYQSWKTYKRQDCPFFSHMPSLWAFLFSPLSMLDFLNLYLEGSLPHSPQCSATVSAVVVCLMKMSWWRHWNLLYHGRKFHLGSHNTRLSWALPQKQRKNHVKPKSPRAWRALFASDLQTGKVSSWPWHGFVMLGAQPEMLDSLQTAQTHTASCLGTVTDLQQIGWCKCWRSNEANLWALPNSK